MIKKDEIPAYTNLSSFIMDSRKIEHFEYITVTLITILIGNVVAVSLEGTEKGSTVREF